MKFQISILILFISQAIDCSKPNLSNKKPTIKCLMFPIMLGVANPLCTWAVDSNILTAPVMERIRMIQQIDYDVNEGLAEPKYFSNKVILLVPIVTLEKDLDSIRELLTSFSLKADESSVSKGLSSLSDFLKKESFDKIALKKIFNRYSDNIFYTSPDEANLYLAGGATPSSRQTQQYLLRNDVITYIGNVKGDVQQMMDENSVRSNHFQQDIADALSDLEDAYAALRQYFDLADRNDVEMARRVYSSRSS